MNFKVGDQVKFLNATGGGIVRNVIDHRMVLVAIEGGFEIPTLISELVRMEGSEAGQRFFNETFEVHQEKGPENENNSTDERVSSLKMEKNKPLKNEEIFLAFVPQDQKWLITGIVDIYLINHTSYDILFSLFRKEENNLFGGVDYGSLEPGSRFLLDSVDREQLPAWSSGCLQVLFHKNQVDKIPFPVNAEYEITGKKFYTEGSYRESPLIEGKGILIRISSLHNAAAESQSKKPAPEGELKEKTENNDFIFRFEIAPKEAEVDLHFEALEETPEKIENNEILQTQLTYFTKALESAIANKFRKVIFIHGVGDGILRKAITEKLHQYGILEIQDAPLHQYGSGALVVQIPFNRM